MKVIKSNTKPEDSRRYSRGHLSKNYDDYQVHQKIHIKLEIIKFLKKSKTYKRPPQSIWMSGIPYLGQN